MTTTAPLTRADTHLTCHADPERFMAMAAETDRARNGALPWMTPRPLTHPLLWACRAEAFHSAVLSAAESSVAGPVDSAASLASVVVRAVATDLFRDRFTSATPHGEPEDSDADRPTILVGGRVFTVDEDRPWAEALVYMGERIVAVGARNEIQAAYPGARVIDVEGGLIIPGLNDAHLHHTPDPSGVRLRTDDIFDPTLDDLRTAVAEAVAATPAGTWLMATMGMTLTVEDTLDRDLLDDIAPQHPVALLGMTNHTNVFNSAALRELGIEPDAPDVLGGAWRRDANGRLTGRVDEYAQWRPQRTFAAMTTIEEGAESIRALAAACVRFGVTSVQNMSWTPPERYIEMAGAAATPLRIRLIDFPASGAVRDQVPSVAERAATAQAAGARITRSGRKWILDGTPVEWASDFGRPYLDGTNGAQNFPLTEVTGMLRESVDADDQVLLHAIGTETVRSVVRALEASADVDWSARRMRLEHGDGATADDLAALGKCGAMIVANPSHFLVTDMYTERLGHQHSISPLRSTVAAGITVGIGSDGPLNPFFGLFAALVHPTRMSEAVDAATFLRAHTIGSARAEGTEHEKGRLAPGYLADIAVLDQDIFTMTGPSLMETRSKLTVISGEIVHSTLN
jgi:predicted amidohydrolase YtcJ